MSTNSTDAQFAVQSRAPRQTREIGEALGRLLGRGDVVALIGILGAGKTVLAKGLAQGIGVANARHVSSPGFTLINRYDARVPLYHVDAFRLSNSAQLEALGADEMLYGEGAVVIEWADRVSSLLPPERLEIHMEILGPSERRLLFSGKGKRAAALIQGLRTSVAQ